MAFDPQQADQMRARMASAMERRGAGPGIAGLQTQMRARAPMQPGAIPTPGGPSMPSGNMAEARPAMPGGAPPGADMMRQRMAMAQARRGDEMKGPPPAMPGGGGAFSSAMYGRPGMPRPPVQQAQMEGFRPPRQASMIPDGMRTPGGAPGPWGAPTKFPTGRMQFPGFGVR